LEDSVLTLTHLLDVAYRDSEDYETRQTSWTTREAAETTSSV
jgi:hypothetical protein